MQKKKHHLTKKQANALFLSTLMTTAAFQLTACAGTEYISEDTTKVTITEAIASDTIASSFTTPAVDLVPTDSEDTSSFEETTFESVAETTVAPTETEETTLEITTVETTMETTTAETTIETTTVQTTVQETTAETTTETTVETAPVIETVTEESYRYIPYDTSYVYSEDYEEGVRIVFSEGKRGKIRVTTTKIYENGKLMDTQTVEKTISSAEDRVIIIGTAPKITTETITDKTDILPFATVYEYDDNRYDDDVTVLEEGSDGYTVREYLVTYEGGEEISKELLSEETIAMIPKRILVGTKPATTYETFTQTENIVPFETEYVYDDTLDEGTEIVSQEGSDGYTLLSYRATYYRGEEKARELTDTVVYPPQTKIVVIGTKEIQKEETFGLPYIDAVHGGVDYNVTQHYGNNGHGGMDIAVWYGDPIVAIKSGTVIAAYDEGDFGKDNILWTYGTYVVIEHEGGVRSYYAHLSDRTVRVGDKVEKGEVIGHSGNTGRVNPMPSASNPLAGTHLHFEIRVWNGYGYSTTDPRNYLPGWWGG